LIKKVTNCPRATGKAHGYWEATSLLDVQKKIFRLAENEKFIFLFERI